MLYEVTKETEWVRELSEVEKGAFMLIPFSWSKRLRTDSGNPDTAAMFVLAYLLYWTSPVYQIGSNGEQVVLKRFRGDMYEMNYKQAADTIGISERRVRDAVGRLENKYKVIRRTVVTVHSNSGAYLGKKTYIAPLPDAVKALSKPPSTDSRKTGSVLIKTSRDFLPGERNDASEEREEAIASVEEAYEKKRFKKRLRRKKEDRDWRKPIIEILEFLDWNTTRAEMFVRSACEKAKKDGITNTCPKHIKNIVISLAADATTEMPQVFAEDGGLLI